MISGKQKWISLDADVFSVAKLRLTDEARKRQRLRCEKSAIAGGTCTMGDLPAVYRKRSYIVKTWPGFPLLTPDELLRGKLEDW